jgi:tetratricopeptide (TPR) repeat protein
MAQWPNAFLALCRNDEAVAHYAKTFQINPSHAKTHNNLGLALLNSEDHEKPQIIFNKRCEKTPPTPMREKILTQF